MARDYTEPPHIRIPARVGEDGRLSFYYGGAFPALRTGAIVEVVVSDLDLISDFHRRVLKADRHVELLGKDSIVLAMLGNSFPDAEQAARALVDLSRVYPDAKPGTTTTGVFIKLDTPLILHVFAGRPAQLAPCPCSIPAMKRNASSLNEAYTLISEEFEPKRRSHTGNVFRSIYACANSSGIWHQLDDWRMQALASFEFEIHAECSPWWRSSKFRRTDAEWAYLDAPGDAGVRVYLIDSNAVVREIVDFPNRWVAESWLGEEHFTRIAPNRLNESPPPPAPPYHTARGERVHL